jgi:hypothetical protein
LSSKLAALAGALMGQVGGAIVGVVVGAGLAWAFGLVKGHETTAETKLETVLSDAAHQHLRPILNQRVDLKGTGKRARVMIFRSAKGGYEPTASSDLLRIYEQDGNDLNLVLSLHPTFHPKRNLPYELRRIRVGRFDDTTQQEVRFDMSPLYADTRIPHPVALLWDAAHKSYVLRPLLTKPPQLLPAPSPRSFARGLQDGYKPVDIDLDGGSVLQHVGGAQEFAVGQSRLAVAFVVRQPCNACSDGAYTVRVYSLDFQSAVVARACPPSLGVPTRRSTIIRFDGGPSMRQAVRTALHRKDLACP